MLVPRLKKIEIKVTLFILFGNFLVCLADRRCEPGGFGKTFSGVFECCHVKIIPVCWLLTFELFGSANDFFFSDHANVYPLVISGFDQHQRGKTARDKSIPLIPNKWYLTLGRRWQAGKLVDTEYLARIKTLFQNNIFDLRRLICPTKICKSHYSPAVNLRGSWPF